MMNSIDLANYEGPLRCYVVPSEGDIPGVVTVFFKFGDVDTLNSPCVKLRFRAGQYYMLRETLVTSPEYPGLNLAGSPESAWADLQSDTEAIDGDQVL